MPAFKLLPFCEEKLVLLMAVAPWTVLQ